MLAVQQVKSLRGTVRPDHNERHPIDCVSAFICTSFGNGVYDIIISDEATSFGTTGMDGSYGQRGLQRRPTVCCSALLPPILPVYQSVSTVELVRQCLKVEFLPSALKACFSAKEL
jgi:hypothetical protein